MQDDVSTDDKVVRIESGLIVVGLNFDFNWKQCNENQIAAKEKPQRLVT